MNDLNEKEKSKKPQWPKLTKEIIEGFATSCLTKYYDEASQFADFHREWWELCCSDDKFIAICAPRGHSKSTTITITYTLYGVANPENGQMEFYDKFGELISSRGLTPDEFNGKLFDNEGEASAGAEPLGIGFEKPKPDIEDAEYEEVKNETQEESETEATETQETV